MNKAAILKARNDAPKRYVTTATPTVVRAMRDVGAMQDVGGLVAQLSPREDDVIMTGLALPWGDVYDAGFWTENFERGAFEGAMKDVRMLIEHDGSPIARQSAGFVALRETDRGLEFAAAADPKDTDVANMASRIERGVVNGVSVGFSMRPGGHEEISESDDGVPHYTITQVGELMEFSLVGFPAYEETQVEMFQRFGSRCKTLYKGCPRCRRALPLAAFRVPKLDHFHSHKAPMCLECYNAHRREADTKRRKDNPAKHAARVRKWAKDNPEKVAKHQKRYKNSPKGRVKAMVSSAKERAAKKDLPFDLDEHREELLAMVSIGECSLTGIPFGDVDESKRWNSGSLDRIEPAKGYVIDNVRVVLESVNMAMVQDGEEALRQIAEAYLSRRGWTRIDVGSGGACGNDNIDAASDVMKNIDNANAQTTPDDVRNIDADITAKLREAKAADNHEQRLALKAEAEALIEERDTINAIEDMLDDHLEQVRVNQARVEAESDDRRSALRAKLKQYSREIQDAS